MKNKIVFVSIILSLFFILGAVAAADNSTLEDDGDVISADDEEATISEGTSDETPLGEDEPIATSIKAGDTTVRKGDYFSVELKDANGTGISGKTVSFDVNSQKNQSKTNANGVAKLKINLNAGTYTIKYLFNESGYAPAQGQVKLTVVVPKTSKITASNYVAYQGIKNKYTVTLTADKKPLSGKTVTFELDGKTYNKKTNSKGQASINIDLAKGTYTIKYSYAGEVKIKKTSGSKKITVKKGASVKISKKSSLIFRNKQAGYFKVKLVDVQGNPVASKKVTFTIKGKKYTKTTNKKGIASLKIKRKIGSYKIKVNFKKSSVYKKASKTFTIKVKPKQARNNGFWMLSLDMKKVSFKKLEKYGTKHIFVNAKCLERYGKTYVEKWIKDAKSHGIKVHIWMQVFYSAKGGWVIPVKDGKIKYDLIKSKVKEAKKYAKIKGVAGVHFDYLRFPGNAYNYKNGVKAVNYFTKQASKAIHKVNKKLIVSAAVMPEPSGMKYYYGQDIPTMSKYLDAIVPMVYKGNYHAGDKWIKAVTKAFVKQSKKAKIWTGLQSYRSDENWGKLSAKELMGDADAAALGGAHGVILFRYGLVDYINFNEV